MMRRILIFSTAYLPMVGGAEIAIKSITDNLSREGYQFDLLCAQIDPHLPARERVGAVQVYRLGFGCAFDKYFLPFAALVWALRLHARKKYDIAWVVMASYASLGALVYSRFAPRVKILLTIQEGDSRKHIARRMGFLRGLFRAIFRRSDMVQCISNNLADWAREMGSPRSRISVVPNGVSADAFAARIADAERASLRAKLGILPDEKVIITISRLVHKNGIDNLLRACAFLDAGQYKADGSCPNADIHVISSITEARNSRLKWKLLIFGEGVERQELERLADDLSIRDRVKFLGSIPHADLPRYLAISDVFCRPSRSEGLGNVFLEAMAAGVPVVAPRVGGIKDFLVDGETGFVCGSGEPEDVALALRRALTDSAACAHVIGTAQRMVHEKYDWIHISAQIKGLFEILCGSAAGKGMSADQIDAPFVLYQKQAISKCRKIVIAADIFPPESGGPATYVVTLANGLAERGWHVTVVSLTPYSRADVLDKRVHLCAVHSFKCVPQRQVRKIFRYGEYLGLLVAYVHSADILYAMGPVNAGLPALIARGILRAVRGVSKAPKFVVKVVGDYAWEQGQIRFSVRDTIDAFQTKQYGGMLGLLRRIERFVVKHSDQVIVPSTYLFKMVQGWGVAQSSIALIHNKVSYTDVPDKEKPSGEKWIVSVGRLVPWKGIVALVQVMSDIVQIMPQAKLKIIGDGPEMGRLQKILKSSNTITRCVELLGALPHDETLCYIKSADVFVLNSGYEGFSHVISEAFSFHVPVLASSSGGNNELVKESHLFEYNNKQQIKDKILWVLQNKQEAEDFVLRVETSNDYMIDKTIDSLQNVCAH